MRLRGRNAAGWPQGLTPCPTCGEPRGECLDPSPLFEDLVVTVYCRCAARNRCAGCDQLLHERKLNGNYYDPKDDAVWHVGAIAALFHRCPNATLIKAPPRGRRAGKRRVV
jgi:hypothetical protein